MAKFGKPLKGTLFITQTYHSNSSNKAVDFSAVKDAPVYAIGDGYIKAHYTNLGSYCIFILDGSPIKVFYVHTYRWIPSGQKVKKGEVICYIAPTTLNGGYPTHLHLGLALGYNLIDYLARDNTLSTKYADIKKVWFNADGTFNWKLHKDLDYKTLKPVPAPPVVVPPVVDWEKKSKEQAVEIEGLKTELGALRKELEVERGKVLAREDIILELEKTVSVKEKKILDLENEVKSLSGVTCDLGTFNSTQLVSELLRRFFKRSE